MDNGTVGIWANLGLMTAIESLEFARFVEKSAYSALWVPEGGGGRDLFAVTAELSHQSVEGRHLGFELAG